METKQMELETLAGSLQEALYPAPWLSKVGVGEYEGNACLYVYLASKMPQTAKKKVPKQWHGINVFTRETS